ncbi:MAG: hypothetical protein ACI39E_02555 [Acutalibacteraceae bacterium]
MRRLLAVSVLLCLLLTSCSSGQSVSPMVSGFQSHVGIEYEDMRLQALLERKTTGSLTLTVSEPESIAGLSMTWDGAQLILSLGGLKLAAAPHNLPASALAFSICEALDACAQQRGSLEDGAIKLENEGTNGRYTLLYNAQSGYPELLTIPDLELTVCFSEWQTL